MLRAGIVGAGVFGRIHAKKYSAHEGVTLNAVIDPDQDKADAAAAEFGAAAYADYDAFLDNVDVLTIAAPAAAHYELGVKALRAGRHVYVEKPLALNSTDADEMIETALAQDLVLRVGHQERLVVDALGLFADGATPMHLEFARCGPASGRCEDVSVVFDLMIHDLDLAARWGMGEPMQVDAAGDAHEAVATVHFSGGRTASFIASRRCDERRRTMKAHFVDGDISLDFLSRIGSSTRPQASLRDVNLETALADPLGENVASFLSAVECKATGAAPGRNARMAVRLAELVEHSRLELIRQASSSTAVDATLAEMAITREKLTA